MKTVLCVLDENSRNNRILRKRNREEEIFIFKCSFLDPKYTLVEKSEFQTFQSAFSYFTIFNKNWYNSHFYNVHKDYREYVFAQLLLHIQKINIDYKGEQIEKALKQKLPKS